MPSSTTKDLRAAGARAAASGPCLSPEIDRARDHAALLSMRWALAEVGCQSDDALAHSEAVHVRNRSVVRRWHQEIARAGHSGRTPTSTEVDEAWQRAIALSPEPGSGGTLTSFFADCARELPRILSGEVQVQSLLFDHDEVAEEIYQANEASRYTNAVSAGAIRERCLRVLDHGRMPAILEVGGGVGGTTDVVLDALSDLPVRYHFTDVGEWFVTRALQRWAGRSGLTVGLYDINAVHGHADSGSDRSRSAFDGLAEKFDAVLAANVMHNAQDVTAALRALADVSREQGELVLIETGTEHLPLLISMRFLMEPPPVVEGIGSDRIRTDRILLSTRDWDAAIVEAGWQLQQVLPGTDDPHPVARYDQHAWLATRPAKDQLHPDRTQDATTKTVSAER